MSKALIERIRKQRELKVKLDGRTFIARRPTDVEFVEINRAGASFSELGLKFVTGWEAVTEDYIVGGGGTDLVPFTTDLWSEVWGDRPELWEPISTAIVDAYREHTAAREVTAKNSQPG